MSDGGNPLLLGIVGQRGYRGEKVLQARPATTDLVDAPGATPEKLVKVLGSPQIFRVTLHHSFH